LPDNGTDGRPDAEPHGSPDSRSDGGRDSEATGLPRPTPRPGVGGYSLAIDLGTSFIAAAVADDHGLEMFTLGDGSLVSPAAVYVSGDGRVVPGEAAARRAVSHPDRVAREVKRHLGNPTPLMLGGAPYLVSDLLGALLQDVLVRVTERQGAKPEVVALTHPANWGPFRTERFQDVARSAGLDEPLYTTEPEAAAAHYASTRPLGEGEVLAVYDLGGGTFDATVLRRTAQGFEILGTPEGIERLGGADFDDAIFAHVNYLAGGALSELDMSDPRTVVALARLHQDCTLAKEALSVDAEATIPVFLPNRHFEVTLTRTELEGMVRASIESTIGTLDRVIRAAQVDRTTLAAVLLAGGSSRIPLVAQMVSEAFGRPTVVGAHPKHSVALGAALLAEARRRETSDTSLVGTDAGWTAVGGDGPDVPGPRAASVSQAPSPGAWNGVAAAPVPATTSIPAGGPALTEAVAASAVLPTGAGAGEVMDRDRGGGPTSVVPMPRTGEHSGDVPSGTGQRPPPADGTPPVIPPPSGAARKRPVALIAGLLVLGLAAVGVVVYLTLRPATQTPAATSGHPPASSSAAGAPAGQAPAPPAVATAVPIPSLGTAIDVGPTPNFVVASPSGHQLYVANTSAGVVTVVDTAVNRVTGTIPIKAGPPRFLAFSADGRYVYVSVWDDARTIAAISVLDTTTNTIVNSVPVHTRPFLAAVSHDGRFVYVPNHDTGTVEVIDGATNQSVTEFSVPTNPHSVAVTPDGKKLYIADHESNVVAVVDTSNNTVVTQIPVPRSPHNVAVHPTRPLAVVASYDADSVTAIDTNTNTVIATVPVGHQPQHVAYSADGRFAYITNDGDSSVSVLSLDSLTVTGVIPTGPSPTSMAVLPDGRTGYVSDFGGTTLTVLNLAG
jgi:YVTN family beta-propeller protein